MVVQRLELGATSDADADGNYVSYIEVSAPMQIRLLDRGAVRMRVGLVEPAAQPQGDGQTAAGSIPTMPSPRIGEARLELQGATIRPPGAISEALPPRQSMEFMWNVVPQEKGVLRGSAWFVLATPHDLPESDLREALSAQPIEIQSTSLWGLNGDAARLIGGVGLVAGVIMVLAPLSSATRR